MNEALDARPVRGVRRSDNIEYLYTLLLTAILLFHSFNMAAGIFNKVSLIPTIGKSYISFKKELRMWETITSVEVTKGAPMVVMKLPLSDDVPPAPRRARKIHRISKISSEGNK